MDQLSSGLKSTCMICDFMATHASVKSEHTSSMYLPWNPLSKQALGLSPEALHARVPELSRRGYNTTCAASSALALIQVDFVQIDSLSISFCAAALRCSCHCLSMLSMRPPLSAAAVGVDTKAASAADSRLTSRIKRSASALICLEVPAGSTCGRTPFQMLSLCQTLG